MPEIYTPDTMRLLRHGCKLCCICHSPMPRWHSSCQERRNRPTDLALSKDDIHTKVCTSSPPLLSLAHTLSLSRTHTHTISLPPSQSIPLSSTQTHNLAPFLPLKVCTSLPFLLLLLLLSLSLASLSLSLSLSLTHSPALHAS